MDCYILKYPEGSEIPPHTDPVPGRKHWRMNVVLKRATVGGRLHSISEIRDNGDEGYIIDLHTGCPSNRAFSI